MEKRQVSPLTDMHRGFPTIVQNNQIDGVVNIPNNVYGRGWPSEVVQIYQTNRTDGTGPISTSTHHVCDWVSMSNRRHKPLSLERTFSFWWNIGLVAAGPVPTLLKWSTYSWMGHGYGTSTSLLHFDV